MQQDKLQKGCGGAAAFPPSDDGTVRAFLAMSARLVLRSCLEIRRVFGYGVGKKKLAGFLAGADSAFMRHNTLVLLPQYGIFRAMKRSWIEQLIELLCRSGYLAVEGAFRPVLCLTEEGEELLATERELPVLPAEIVTDPVLGPACPQSRCELRLRNLRGRLARLLRRNPRQVVSDELLRALAQNPPQEKEGLSSLLPPILFPYRDEVWEVLQGEIPPE